MDCVFCQIGQGRAPAARVFEDEHCCAFMDIHPLGRGHVLVIPKTHVVQITELSDPVSNHLFSVARNILKAQRVVGWGVDGTNLLINDGKAANQTLPHTHIHVIPREKGDSLKSAGRLLLHVTGLFGPKTRPHILQEQAEALRNALETPSG
ncbi:HIT family protein [Marinobacter nanhaiticus D15-8W]|uniref:HIT family protein n=1 Tax=Marinobacter nanhaiticus D15-8W TaxID=626887 RepID=N6VZR8_9GAMM|nr:HIT family protein [Marinobacter nanhaiticus]ENO13399.1 HIT family protein [Marinobacter nanhaiticus D15-8W]BES70766.1 HIT family protein [Marinobacter nanhaiticus D15-8W]